MPYFHSILEPKNFNVISMINSHNSHENHYNTMSVLKRHKIYIQKFNYITK